METLNLEMLLNRGGSISEVQKYALSFNPHTPPEYLRRPILSGNSPSDYRAHATALEAYEVEKEIRKQQQKTFSCVQSEIDSVFEQYIREKSGLNTIPEQYRDKVYSYAYQQGHSSGYCEVYNYLLELVYIF